MSAPSSAEFARLMEPVALEVLGEPNKALSNKTELRWGNRGSFCVDRTKGTWCDHEDGDCGGGVLDFLRIRQHLEKADALQWLRDHHMLGVAEVNGKTRIIDTYDYTDEAGHLLFQVVRFEPKDFRQRAPDGRGGWVWKMEGVKRVLYRLPKVIAAVSAGQTVFVVEGEKGVAVLERLGFVGTCSPAGAGKWRQEYSAWLRDADVVLLPDNDEAGRKHVDQVVVLLRGVAKRIRVLALPSLPEKGDIADWIDAGGTAAKLEALAASATDPGQRKDPPKPSNGKLYDDKSGYDLGEEPLEDAFAGPTQEAIGAAKAKFAAKVATTIHATVTEFNGRYMVVNEAGRAVIYQPTYDPILKRRRIDRLTTRDLLTLYMNRHTLVGEDAEGRPIYKPSASVWLKHPDRRQFIHGVVFDPSGSEPEAGVLNLWEGFAFTPAPGDWSILHDHIWTNICNANPVHFDYLMGWMARMVQRPAEQGEVAVVLKGGEGSGKGTLAKVLQHILGQYSIRISNAKHLTGNFNGHLRDCVFLFADEAFYAGDKQHIGVLKSLVTESILTIEAKHQTPIQVPNMLHILMASNEEWVVPAALDARRFFVLLVSDLVANDHAYFAELWQQMENGGYAALLHDLLTLDISNFNVRAVPETKGLQQQRKLSLPIPEAWWLDCLHRGYVFRSKLGLDDYFAEWKPEVSTELLFASYTEFADKHRERHPMSRETLGEFIRKMGAKSKRPSNVAVGEHRTEELDAYGHREWVTKVIVKERAWGYALGNLDSARQAFSAQTGLTIEWEPPEEVTQDPIV